MMLQFIVLGLIPGTNTQISLGFILGFSAIVLIMALLLMEVSSLRQLVRQIVPITKYVLSSTGHTLNRLRGFVHKASTHRV